MNFYNKNAGNQYMDKVQKVFSKNNYTKRTNELLESNTRPTYDSAMHCVTQRSEAHGSGLHSNAIMHGFSKCGTCTGTPPL
jgi:hypothetical protein